MNLDDIPIFSMLKGRLGYLNRREQLIAQNVANADTPGYTGKDLKPFSFASQVGALRPVAPSMTNASHMSGSLPVAAGGLKAVASPDSETTLDGNQVVLEEQMIKMTAARMNYEAAIGFYQQSLSLIRTASRAPNR